MPGRARARRSRSRSIAPRQGLTFSPVIIVAALLTVLIAVFAVYIGVQLVRFAKPPTLAVTNPAQAVIDVAEDATTYTLRGTSIPGATITITAAGRDQPYRVSADAAGRWSVDVDLRRGRNQFDITALDPDTGKQAETTARVFITVPFLVIEAPTLNVDSPAEGAQFENGAIPVKGTTTNAKTVSVSANLLGAGATASPRASTSRRPRRRARPPPPAAPTVGPITVDVARGRVVRDAARPLGGTLADRRHRDLGRGQGRHADPERLDQVQGRQPGRDDQGLPRLAQGLGGREDLGRDRARPARSTTRARC